MSQWNADLYRNCCSFVWENASDLMTLLAPSAGERILDLGCGSGELTAKIAASGAEVVGADSAPAMLAQAQDTFPAIRFVLGDAARPEFSALFDGAGFDAVFSNAALHWIRPERVAAANIAALLRPGGRLVAELGGKNNVRQVCDAIAQAVQDAGYPPVVEDESWFFPSIGEYASLLEQEGLEVLYASLFDRPTPQEGGGEGFRLWLSMFGWKILRHVPEGKTQDVLARAEEALRPSLFRDGRWVLDYRRIRVLARRR